MELKENLTAKKEMLTTAKEVVELLSKFMLGGLAVCYALGLLVVNLYYNRFGVYSLSLFQVTYVAAGMWILLPILFVLLAIVTVMFMLGKVVSLMDWADRPSRNRIMVGVAFLLFLHLALVVMTRDLKISLTAKQCFLLLLSSSIVGVLIVTILITVFTTRRRFVSAAFTILFPIALIMHTIVFAGIYGAIPAHLGGGGTKDVQLLLNIVDKDKKFYELSGLRFYENSNWTRTAQLLFATEDEYIFLVKPPEWVEGSTLSIKKDVIQSILYQGLRGGGGGDNLGADEALTPPESSPTIPARTSPATPETSPTP